MVRSVTYMILIAFCLSCKNGSGNQQNISEKNRVEITNGAIQLVINNKLHTKVNNLNEASVPLVKAFHPSEYLVTKHFVAQDFIFESEQKTRGTDSIGTFENIEVIGNFEQEGIQIKKTINYKIYKEFADIILQKVSYENMSDSDLEISKWLNNAYTVASNNDTPKFWSFHGSSSSARQDWILPLKPGFYQKNYMGSNQSDYGGGIPVVDIWRPDGGIAIGHTSLVPKLVSLPVDFDQYSEDVKIHIEQAFDIQTKFAAGEKIETLETFVAFHKGDYYNSLKLYTHLMRAKGIDFVESEPDAYESIWCAWGYERNFTMEEVIGTLPKVKELGIKWAVLDDGFQQTEGDWNVNKEKFPGGNAQMKAFVDTVHSYGLKAKLWWAPLAVNPKSELLEKNPDILLLNNDSSPQWISWWDAFYMSPVSKTTLKHTEEVVHLFMEEWGFDGLKMDGQHMNAVPPDYQSGRDIEHPIQAVEALPEFFKTIYTTARNIKPNAVVENCPCGTCMSYYNMAYTNQFVSSDPTSSWQVRHKGKTYKALAGEIAYYGDHVELSDNGDDFASSFGIGAVLGTKFTWPKDNPTVETSYVLTEEKEANYKKWFSLYNEKMLSKEEYLGSLYDIGYDKPETHVIKKSDTLHYAFYADSWNKKIQLKGLGDKKYKLYDYYNKKNLGTVEGLNASITVSFEDFLLLEAIPIN